MAADGVNEIKLTLVRANKTYQMKLSLSEYETGGTIAVKDIAQEIERLTKIKRSNQRIIFKGRELSDDNCTLSLLGMKDGSKIHVLKKQYDPDVVKPGHRIEVIERQLRTQDKLLNCLIHKFDVMQRELIPCQCSCENIMDLLFRTQECQRRYEELCNELNSVETEEEVLVKRKQRLLCRIQAKLRCNESLHIAVEDVPVRMTF